MTKLTHIEIEIRRFALLGVEAEISRLKTLAGELREEQAIYAPEPNLPWLTEDQNKALDWVAEKSPLTPFGLADTQNLQKALAKIRDPLPPKKTKRKGPPVGVNAVWKYGGWKTTPEPSLKPKRKMSAAGRAAISKAQKARWKKAKVK